MSARMYLPKASGLIGIGSTASAASRSRKSDAVSTLFKVSLSVASTGGGRPAGPTTPYHWIASNPL